MTQQSLGEYLRQEREKRGITIEQVASATKIGVRLLMALEEDRYAELPAKPFIRGFVTSYARFVGMDPKQILIQYAEYLEEKSHDRPNKEAGHSGYAFEKRDTDQSRTVLWFVLGGFIIAGVLAFAILKPQLHRSRGSHMEKLQAKKVAPVASPSPADLLLAGPSPSPSVAAVLAEAKPETKPSNKKEKEKEKEKETKPEPKPEPKVEAKKEDPNYKVPAKPLVLMPEDMQASANASAAVKEEEKAAEKEEKPDPLNSGINLKTEQIKHKLVLKTKENVWVRYKADERPMMKFVLKKDKMLVLRAEKTIKVQVGDNQVVTYSYNNRAYKPMNPENGAALRKGNPSLVYPKEAIENTDELFRGERTLPVIQPAPAAVPQPSPSPS